MSTTELITTMRESALALTKAADALLADAQARAAITDPDEWTRMPQKRCPVSGWSPSTLRRKVRTKKVGGTAFYSMSDVRALLRTN
jgi:hypothetical protein